MKIHRSTPVLIVDGIEPNLDFWERRLGYKREVEVPHEDALGFVILKRDDQEVMMQARKSIEADLPAIMPYVSGNAVVQFIEVDSLDEILERLSGIDWLVQPRTTFYGMREIVVRDPAGYVLIFAQRV